MVAIVFAGLLPIRWGIPLDPGSFLPCVAVLGIKPRASYMRLYQLHFLGLQFSLLECFRSPQQRLDVERLHPHVKS